VSLFRSSDIASPEHEAAVITSALGLKFYTDNKFATGEQLATIADQVGVLLPGISCSFVTHGAWSNIELLEYCLSNTGPANVYFSTWAISPEAITRFGAWMEGLKIIDLYAVMDSGLRNRKPEVYQQATGVFKKLVTCKCHAKVTVIQNDDHSLVIIGSANYTKNPRIEAGVIICDKTIADQHIGWILEEFN